MANEYLGTITIEVERQPDKKFDIYIANDGSSGCHYTNLTADDVGRMVADYVETSL